MHQSRFHQPARPAPGGHDPPDIVPGIIAQRVALRRNHQRRGQVAVSRRCQSPGTPVARHLATITGLPHIFGGQHPGIGMGQTGPRRQITPQAPDRSAPDPAPCPAASAPKPPPDCPRQIAPGRIARQNRPPAARARRPATAPLPPPRHPGKTPGGGVPGRDDRRRQPRRTRSGGTVRRRDHRGCAGPPTTRPPPCRYSTRSPPPRLRCTMPPRQQCRVIPGWQCHRCPAPRVPRAPPTPWRHRAARSWGLTVPERRQIHGLQPAAKGYVRCFDFR